MPEATIDENSQLFPRVGNVGSTWCLLPVQTIAGIADVTQHLANKNLWGGILALVGFHRFGNVFIQRFRYSMSCHL